MAKSTPNGSRAKVLGILTALVLQAGITLPAFAADVHHFDIKTTDAATAIHEFGNQSGVQILASAEVLNGKQLNRLFGDLSTDDGFQKLLAGTGLSHRYVGDRAVALVTESPAANSEPSARTPTAPPATNMPATADANAPKKTGWFDRFRLAFADENTPAKSSDQKSTVSDDTVELGEIVVTGSRLRQRGIAVEGPSPVVVFDRAKFEQIGAVSIPDVLRQLSQTASNMNDRAGGTSPAGALTVQLRGLPDNATLVLIDGRRVQTAPSARAGAADLNSIPLSAVERIEVLTDGASAIYGADAVAGVVNIILRKNFEGLEASLRYGNTTRTDSSERRGTFVFGTNLQKLNVLLSGEAFDRNQMFQSDLPGIFPSGNFTSVGGTDQRVTAVATPGTIFAVSGNLNGVGAPRAILPVGQNGVGLTQSSFLPTAGQQNLASQAPGTSVVGGARRFGIASRLTYPFNDRLTAFGNFQYADNDQLSTRARFPVVGATIPAANPFNPFGQSVRFSGALMNDELPGSVFDITNKVKVFRGVLGIAQDFGNGWDFEAAASYQEDKSGAFSHQLNNARLQTHLTTVTNPATALNLFNTVAFNRSDLMLSFLDQQIFRYRLKTPSADARLRADLFSLPGGTVQAVAGAEGYRNTYTAVAIGLNIVERERKVWAGFAELSIPIVGAGNASAFARELTFNLAGRHDHYSDFGTTTNPKASLMYRPVRSVFLRGSWGTFFRAPTMADAYQPFVVGPGAGVATDPRRSGVSTTFTVATGGNINLRPEEGRSWNAGVGWQPQALRDLSLTVDYWNLKQDNVNARIPLSNVSLLLAFENLFAQFIHRADPSPTDIAAGQPGVITQIDSIPLNFGLRSTDGVDFQIQYGLATAIGRMSLSLLGTRTLSFVEALVPGGTPIERVGYSNAGTTLFPPKWKGTTTLAWENRRWAASLTGRYVGSVLDFNIATNAIVREMRPVWTWDAALAYGFGEAQGWLSGTKIRIGGQNIFDRPPEFSVAAFGPNTIRDDLRGRFLYVDLSKKF